MEFIWMLIVGGLIGWLAGVMIGKDIPGGVIGNIIAGIIGSWLGGGLFGHWGPQIAGFSLLPSFIGAVLVILVLVGIMRAARAR